MWTIQEGVSIGRGFDGVHGGTKMTFVRFRTLEKGLEWPLLSVSVLLYISHCTWDALCNCLPEWTSGKPQARHWEQYGKREHKESAEVVKKLKKLEQELGESLKLRNLLPRTSQSTLPASSYTCFPFSVALQDKLRSRWSKIRLKPPTTTEVWPGGSNPQCGVLAGKGQSS